jgi:hypothetical protein
MFPLELWEGDMKHLCLAALLLVVGCGSDDSDSSDSEPRDELDGTHWIFLDPEVSGCIQLLSFSDGAYSNAVLCNLTQMQTTKGLYTYTENKLTWTPKQKTCPTMVDQEDTMAVSLTKASLTLPTTDGESVTFMETEAPGERAASVLDGCFTDAGDFVEHPLTPES